MLSVNIPVFNIDVRPLVLQLLKQVENLDADAEIRVYDDNSTPTVKIKNRDVVHLPHVVYREMEKNMGRAAIRNKMGTDSKNKYLLFIDADSRIVSDNYLKNYLNKIKNNRVLCGGTTYSSDPPQDLGKLLRWHYGSGREAVSAKDRNNKKGFIITSNNFLIDKTLFTKIPFRDNIGYYGHEDTLLGYDLFKQGILIIHIENPVEHTGLENSKHFLVKTQMALKNLLYISKEVAGDDPVFIQQVQLLNKYKKITSLVPAFLIRLFFSLFHKYLINNLTGKHPFLIFFDLYKLGYFAELHNKKAHLIT